MSLVGPVLHCDNLAGEDGAFVFCLFFFCFFVVFFFVFFLFLFFLFFFFCSSLVCYMCVVCHRLFIIFHIPLDLIGRLCFVTLALPGYLPLFFYNFTDCYSIKIVYHLNLLNPSPFVRMLIFLNSVYKTKNLKLTEILHFFFFFFFSNLICNNQDNLPSSEIHKDATPIPIDLTSAGTILL